MLSALKQKHLPLNHTQLVHLCQQIKDAFNEEELLVNELNDVFTLSSASKLYECKLKKEIPLLQKICKEFSYSRDIPIDEVNYLNYIAEFLTKYVEITIEQLKMILVMHTKPEKLIELAAMRVTLTQQVEKLISASNVVLAHHPDLIVQKYNSLVGVKRLIIPILLGVTIITKEVHTKQLYRAVQAIDMHQKPQMTADVITSVEPSLTITAKGMIKNANNIWFLASIQKNGQTMQGYIPYILSGKQYLRTVS